MTSSSADLIACMQALPWRTWSTTRHFLAQILYFGLNEVLSPDPFENDVTSEIVYYRWSGTTSWRKKKKRKKKATPGTRWIVGVANDTALTVARQKLDGAGAVQASTTFVPVNTAPDKY